MFFILVLLMVIVFGMLLYMVEGLESGFILIFISIYWVVVIVIIVGYGDILLKIGLGKFIVMFVMFLGYVIIVVLIGIVMVGL